MSAGFAVAVLGFWTAGVASSAEATADAPRAAAASVAEAPPLLRDPAQFGAYVDRYFGEAARRENRVVGGVVLAVDASGVVFERGYGVRDLESQVAVDAQRDIFQVASVSKILLGTAVMRLIEQGRLSLDDDLRNVIRSFEVPDRFGQPILVRHALTHTTGMVDRMDGTSAPTFDQMIPLVDLFRRYPVEQIAPPGLVPSYCNYCIAMLAVAIQDITGLDYRDWLLQQVFQPLDMDAATMFAPAMANAAPLRDRLVSMYMWDKTSGEFLKYPIMARSLYPNGSVAASAPSMGQFMRMILNEGRHEGASFLRPESVRAMLAPHDWPHPKVPTFGLSMKYGVQNGVRYLGHSGNYRGTDSSLVILPDYGFAYFLSYTGGNSTYHRRFLVDLLNAAFAKPATAIQPLADSKARLSRYTGRYTDFRFTLNTPMAFAMLFPGQTRIVGNDDGTLSLTIPRPYFDGGTVRYVEVEPNLFRKVDSGDPEGIGPNLIDYLVFREDENGQVKYFTTAVNNHAISGIKVPWYRWLPVALAALAASTAVFVIYLVGLPIVALVRRRRGAAVPRMPVAARVAAVLISVCAPAFVLKYLVTMTSQRDWTILYSFQSLGLHAWFALPLVAVVSTTLLAALVIRAWARHEGTRGARVAYTALAVAGIVYALQMAQFRVLDYYF